MNTQKQKNKNNFIPESQTKSTTQKRTTYSQSNQQEHNKIDSNQEKDTWRSYNTKNDLSKEKSNSNKAYYKSNQQSHSDPTTKAPLPQGNDAQSKAKQADHRRDWDAAIKHQKRAIEQGQRTRSAVSDLAAIQHQLEQTDTALQLLTQQEHVFREEGEEAIVKQDNLKKTLMSQSELNNGKEKLKKIRLDGLPLKWNSEKGKDWVISMFSEPKRIQKVWFKQARKSTVRAKAEEDTTAVAETGTEQCTQDEAHQLCAIVECVSASAVRKTLTSYEYLECEKYPIWWIDNDLNPIRDANFKKKAEDQTAVNNSEESASNTQSNNNSTVEAKLMSTLAVEKSDPNRFFNSKSPPKNFTYDSYKSKNVGKTGNPFFEELPCLDKVDNNKTVFKKAWRKDKEQILKTESSQINTFNEKTSQAQDWSKVEPIYLDFSENGQIDLKLKDIKLTDKQQARYQQEFDDIQVISRAFDLADGVLPTEAACHWDGPGFNQAVFTPPPPGFNKQLDQHQFNNFCMAQTLPYVVCNGEHLESMAGKCGSDPVFLRNRDSMAVGQAVLKTHSEVDVSGQVDWGEPVDIDGKKYGYVRSNPSSWEEVYSDIGVEQNRELIDMMTEPIKSQTDKTAEETIQRMQKNKMIDLEDVQRMSDWEKIQYQYQNRNLPHKQPDMYPYQSREYASHIYNCVIINNLDKTMEQHLMCQNYLQEELLNNNQITYQPNSMQCNELNLICNEMQDDVNYDINTKI